MRASSTSPCVSQAASQSHPHTRHKVCGKRIERRVSHHPPHQRRPGAFSNRSVSTFPKTLPWTKTHSTPCATAHCASSATPTRWVRPLPRGCPQVACLHRTRLPFPTSWWTPTTRASRPTAGHRVSSTHAPTSTHPLTRKGARSEAGVGRMNFHVHVAGLSCTRYRYLHIATYHSGWHA